MTDPVEALILDLLEWIGPSGRRYDETIEVWRTSCPRLPVWEEAQQRGFIDHHGAPGQATRIALTPRGIEHLRSARTLVGAAGPVHGRAAN
jgi:hypothetical protein